MFLITFLFSMFYLYLMTTSWIVAKRSKYDITEWLIGAVPLTLLFLLLVYKINF